ncbi:hypothetical protein N7470_007565 [Penicillium chermesinum]|nr:hypothetical protein N7470_007565 [Penicillium chermesinum]
MEEGVGLETSCSGAQVKDSLMRSGGAEQLPDGGTVDARAESGGRLKSLKLVKSERPGWIGKRLIDSVDRV